MRVGWVWLGRLEIVLRLAGVSMLLVPVVVGMGLRRLWGVIRRPGQMDPDINHWAASWMGRWGLRILGLRAEVPSAEELRRLEPCVFVGNHQSALDVLTFGSCYPPATLVVGKKQLAYIPLFGAAFWLGHNLFLDRENRTRARSALSRVGAAVLKRGASVLIFAEGTRNSQPERLLPFKRGAFRLAIETGLPIAPLISSPVRSRIDWRLGRIDRATPVRIQALELIVHSSAATQGQPASASERELSAESTRARVEALAELTQARMQAALDAMRGVTP